MMIKMKPIGYIQSPFKDTSDIPRQSILAEDKKAVIEMLPEFQAGIEDIKENSYGIILFHFHQSKEAPIKVIPYGRDVLTGVFSTRSPRRPNGIGMSIVKITKVEPGKLEFQGVDMLDGTPVLDIKPYSADLNPKE